MVDAVNKKPLVVFKYVSASITDEDIKSALRNQNRRVFENMSEQDRNLDSNLEIIFRKKTKNPAIKHIVARVIPSLWRKLVDSGYVHIDMQRVRVDDHSPLIQCSMCLGYGHSRKLCKETVPKCSHCGGDHIKAKCGEWLISAPPSCCNCSQAKIENKAHNAFSDTCPIRQKWDQLARATTEYT